MHLLLTNTISTDERLCAGGAFSVLRTRSSAMRDTKNNEYNTISLVKFFVGAVTGAGAHFFIDVLAGYEANTCREKRVPPSAQRNALQRTLPRMPSDAEVRHDKQANAAQARQVIDIFHEISTLLVGIPSTVLSYMV